MKKRNEWFTSTVALLSLILFQFWVQNTYSDRGVVQYADDSTGHAASKSWDKTEEALSKMTTNLEHYAYENGLHLNSPKTQKLKLGHAQTPTSDKTP